MTTVSEARWEDSPRERIIYKIAVTTIAGTSRWQKRASYDQMRDGLTFSIDARIVERDDSGRIPLLNVIIRVETTQDHYTQTHKETYANPHHAKCEATRLMKEWVNLLLGSGQGLRARMWRSVHKC